MMGIHQPQPELFSYQVNLEQRIRADHPLRRVAQAVDFSFVRAEVARSYGHNGHESVDPVILLKMMFLLFWDNVAGILSEDRFTYQPASDTYLCPAGQQLRRRRYFRRQRVWE
jgi:hypothetical protein